MLLLRMMLLLLLFFWVPKLEVPETIVDAAIVAGDNPFVDLSLLNSTGEVRVLVSRPLDWPFIFEKYDGELEVGIKQVGGESNKMPVIPGEALKEAVPAADKVLAGRIQIVENVTSDVNEVVQDSESDNVSLREWMSKTCVKMVGKENLKPVTREVEKVVKRPRSPLKELADNVVAATTSGKKSHANIRFLASVLGLIQGPNDSLIMKPASLIKPKMKKGRLLRSLNQMI
ncbi:hypothetical protein ACLB2K_029661 [Fragaria x ananassa]